MNKKQKAKALKDQKNKDKKKNQKILKQLQEEERLKRIQESQKHAIDSSSDEEDKKPKNNTQTQKPNNNLIQTNKPSANPRISAEIAGLRNVSIKIPLIKPLPLIDSVMVPLIFAAVLAIRILANMMAVTNAATSINGYSAPIKPS